MISDKEENEELIKLNIDIANKYLIDSIYSQAVLEGISVTYKDTEDIIMGAKVKNITAIDVMKIINLKRAWEYILDENIVLEKSNISMLMAINKFVEGGFYYNAGRLRSVPVKIGGSSYIPPIPIESQIKEDLSIITDGVASVEKGIMLLLYVMKKQIFLDGNKRTAVIFANHYFVSNSLGILILSKDKIDYFRDLLINYYETDDSKDIIKFLEECLIKLN